MRIIISSLAAAAALSIFAFPAAAQQRTVAASPQNQSGRTGTAASQGQRPRTSGDRVLCMSLALSGSHITRRVCRTEQEWRARGELDAD